MDGTGVGDAIYDRLKRSPDYVVEPFVFSRQGKSELYKNLNSEIRAKRVHYPFDNEVKETREFEKFQIQMLDLRSEEHTSELQSRQYLVCRLLLEKKKKPMAHAALPI